MSIEWKCLSHYESLLFWLDFVLFFLVNTNAQHTGQCLRIMESENTVCLARFFFVFSYAVGPDYTALIILLSAYIIMPSASLQFYLSLPRVTLTTNENHYVARIADCDRSWRQICQKKK